MRDGLEPWLRQNGYDRDERDVMQDDQSDDGTASGHESCRDGPGADEIAATLDLERRRGAHENPHADEDDQAAFSFIGKGTGVKTELLHTADLEQSRNSKRKREDDDSSAADVDERRRPQNTPSPVYPTQTSLPSDFPAPVIPFAALSRPPPSPNLTAARPPVLPVKPDFDWSSPKPSNPNHTYKATHFSANRPTTLPNRPSPITATARRTPS